MVIDDFDVVGVAIFPCETDSPLIIYPNTVLPGPIVFHFFQSIARRYSQFVDSARVVQHTELPSRGVLDIGREPLDSVTTPDFLSRL